jgi:hypothetical protein
MKLPEVKFTHCISKDGQEIIVHCIVGAAPNKKASYKVTSAEAWAYLNQQGIRDNMILMAPPRLTFNQSGDFKFVKLTGLKFLESTPEEAQTVAAVVNEEEDAENDNKKKRRRYHKAYKATIESENEQE